MTGRKQDAFNDRIGRIGRNWFRVVTVKICQPLEMFRIAVEPGHGNPKSVGDEFQRRGGRIALSGFYGFERRNRKTGGLGQ